MSYISLKQNKNVSNMTAEIHTITIQLLFGKPCLSQIYMGYFIFFVLGLLQRFQH